MLPAMPRAENASSVLRATSDCGSAAKFIVKPFGPTVIGGPLDVENASPIAPSTAPLMVPPAAAAAVLLPPACDAWRFWLSGLLLVGGGGQFAVCVGPSRHGSALPVAGTKLVNANAAMPLSNSFFKAAPHYFLK